MLPYNLSITRRTIIRSNKISSTSFKEVVVNIAVHGFECRFPCHHINVASREVVVNISLKAIYPTLPSLNLSDFFNINVGMEPQVKFVVNVALISIKLACRRS